MSVYHSRYNWTPYTRMALNWQHKHQKSFTYCIMRCTCYNTKVQVIQHLNEEGSFILIILRQVDLIRKHEQLAQVYTLPCHFPLGILLACTTKGMTWFTCEYLPHISDCSWTIATWHALLVYSKATCKYDLRYIEHECNCKLSLYHMNTLALLLPLF